jgi:hypothetical protein
MEKPKAKKELPEEVRKKHWDVYNEKLRQQNSANPSPGEPSRVELKKRAAGLPSAPRSNRTTFEDPPSWRVLQDLLFYWLTLPPEVGEERIKRLLRHHADDPMATGVISGLVEHFKELLSTGTVQRSLVDSWNRKIAEDKRMETTTQLSKRIGNPVFQGSKGKPGQSSWSQHREEIVRRLLERYPYIKEDKDGLEAEEESKPTPGASGKPKKKKDTDLWKAFVEENKVILQSPMDPGEGLTASKPDPAGEDGLGIISYYIQGLPADQRDALNELKSDIEEVLLNDLLGEKYRSTYKTVSADTPLNTEEDDASTIADTLPDEYDDSNPEEEARSVEMSEKFELIAKGAKLSKQEAESLWLKSEGYDPREIAPMLNTNARTVSVALSHAITKLIKKYGEKALKDMLEGD